MNKKDIINTNYFNNNDGDESFNSSYILYKRLISECFLEIETKDIKVDEKILLSFQKFKQFSKNIKIEVDHENGSIILPVGRYFITYEAKLKSNDKIIKQICLIEKIENIYYRRINESFRHFSNDGYEYECNLICPYRNTDKKTSINLEITFQDKITNEEFIGNYLEKIEELLKIKLSIYIFN